LHSVLHFLVEGGRAAFVMPRSIFDGDQHHKFRVSEFAHVVPFAITEVWDLDEVENLFKVPSCVVQGARLSTVTRGEADPIPACFWSSLSAPESVRSGSIVLWRLGKKTAWLEYDPMTLQARSCGYYSDIFRQGADLMPRTALFVELINDDPAQTIVAAQTSDIEVANRSNKRFKGRRFRGLVNRRYLFSTVTSNVLLPFAILEDQLPTVLLPIEFIEGEPNVLSRQELIDRGDVETAKWFADVDREIGDNKIRDRIDVRKKLSQQRYTRARFLVHYGASGTHPCAAIQEISKKSKRPFVADQTTYVCSLEDEDEAFYLIGVLNSPVLSDMIRMFQAKGGFGARHLHKLPVNVIPAYESEDPLHQDVVALSEVAAAAARNVLSERMCDQTRPVSQRRTMMRRSINSELTALCEATRELLKL